jgi:hypothetical protein
MTENDMSAPHAAGESRTRALLPAQLSARIGRCERHRVSLDRALRQMRLFSRMAERLGVTAPRSALTHAVAREAELGCLECTASHRCRQWLDGNSPDDDYREFCPNEGLLGVLPHGHL